MVRACIVICRIDITGGIRAHESAIRVDRSMDILYVFVYVDIAFCLVRLIVADDDDTKGCILRIQVSCDDEVSIVDDDRLIGGITTDGRIPLDILDSVYGLSARHTDDEGLSALLHSDTY